MPGTSGLYSSVSSSFRQNAPPSCMTMSTTSQQQRIGSASRSTGSMDAYGEVRGLPMMRAGSPSRVQMVRVELRQARIEVAPFAAVLVGLRHEERHGVLGDEE